DLRAVLGAATITWRYSCSFERLVEQTQRPVEEFLQASKRASNCRVRVSRRRKQLIVYYTAPAIRRTWWADAESFANNLLSLANSGVLEDWADGITVEQVRRISDVASEIRIKHSWLPGDVLLVDNTRVMHGREAWSGDIRKINVRMLTLDATADTGTQAGRMVRWRRMRDSNSRGVAPNTHSKRAP
ncbi:MAG: hypothetical protein QOG34_378, partial [Frankiaceae bacterium]|nr:hypothetical protein [Frankiaceae bacterium]